MAQPPAPAFIPDLGAADPAAIDAARAINPALLPILAATPRANFGEGLPYPDPAANMDLNTLGFQVLQLFNRQVVVRASFAGAPPQYVVGLVVSNGARPPAFGIRFSPATPALPGTVAFTGPPSTLAVADPGVRFEYVVSSAAWLLEVVRQQAAAAQARPAAAGPGGPPAQDLAQALAAALGPLLAQSAAMSAQALAQLKSPETVAADLGWRKSSHARAVRLNAPNAARATAEELKKMELQAAASEEENADVGVLSFALLALRAGAVDKATALLEERAWERTAPTKDPHLREAVRANVRARAVDFRVPGAFGVVPLGDFARPAPPEYRDYAGTRPSAPNAPAIKEGKGEAPKEGKAEEKKYPVRPAQGETEQAASELLAAKGPADNDHRETAPSWREALLAGIGCGKPPRKTAPSPTPPAAKAEGSKVEATSLKGGGPDPSHPTPPPPGPPTYEAAVRNLRPRSGFAQPLSPKDVAKKAALLKGAVVEARWAHSAGVGGTTWVGRVSPSGRRCEWFAFVPPSGGEPVAMRPVTGELPHPGVLYYSLAARAAVMPPPRPNDGGWCAVNAALSCLVPCAGRFPPGIIAEAVAGDNVAKRKLIEQLRREAGEAAFSPGNVCARKVLQMLAAKIPNVFTSDNRGTSNDGPPTGPASVGESSLEDGWSSAAFYNTTARHWIALVRLGGSVFMADDDRVEERSRAPPGFEAAIVVRPDFRCARDLPAPSANRAKSTTQPGPATTETTTRPRKVTRVPATTSTAPAPTANAHDPKTWTFLPSNVLPSTTEKGVSKGQRDEHKRWLRTIASELTEVSASSVIRLIEKLQLERGWAHSTKAKHLATIGGALRRLPQYTNCPPLMLNLDPNWTDASKGVKMDVNTTLPQQAVPVTLTDVTTAIAALDPDDKAAIAIAWLTTARLGDVLQLTKSDVKLDAQSITVSFRRGKRARLCGPYTVSSAVATGWAPPIRDLLARKKVGEFLWSFPVLSARLRAQTELIHRCRAATGNGAFESRGLRRGALQTLAKANVPEETLLLFSGHTQMKTLLRYLDFGKHASHRASRTREAAKALLPTTTSPSTGGTPTLPPRPNRRTKAAAPSGITH